MEVQFDRAPGYGDNVTLELDVLPRVGDAVHWDGRTHEVRSVTWLLNSLADDDQKLNPVVRVSLDANAPI